MGKKLYVGNLAFSVTDQTLQDVFAETGGVESARIITDKDTGRSKGFGFVEMATDEEATEAITRLNGHRLDGREIKVSEAKPMTPRENRGRGFGGGGRSFGGGGRRY